MKYFVWPNLQTFLSDIIYCFLCNLIFWSDAAIDKRRLIRLLGTFKNDVTGRRAYKTPKCEWHIYEWSLRQGNLIQGKAQLALKNWKKPVQRPKGRYLNKLRSMLFTITKTNFSISLSCLHSGLQSCLQAIRLLVKLMAYFDK